MSSNSISGAGEQCFIMVDFAVTVGMSANRANDCLLYVVLPATAVRLCHHCCHYMFFDEELLTRNSLTYHDCFGCNAAAVVIDTVGIGIGQHDNIQDWLGGKINLKRDKFL
jgi:hypothetical protein